MIETVSKNLWLLLTVVLPGFFTYGLWRLSLFFISVKPLSDDVLKQIDSSTLTTTCIIFAFALIQQSVAIAIESLLYRFGKLKSTKSKFRILFCDRFDLAAKNKLNENAERMVGNFFLSLNMSIGIGMIMGYFLIHVGFAFSRQVILGLSLLLIATLATTCFPVDYCRENYYGMYKCPRIGTYNRTQSAKRSKVKRKDLVSFKNLGFSLKLLNINLGRIRLGI